MADILTGWNPEEQRGEWRVAGADLVSDDGLETAVLLSLFSDALASEQEAADAGATDRRGWWGDAFAAAGEHFGSKLWLLRREKRTAQTVERARRYAADALAWLVGDGVADAVDVEAEMVGLETLGLQVTITRKREPLAQYRFERFWTGD